MQVHQDNHLTILVLKGQCQNFQLRVRLRLLDQVVWNWISDWASILIELH
jgi:hypothetical protein